MKEELIGVEIDRATWCRGKGAAGSGLLLEDGTRCCLGFVAKAVGIPDPLMQGVTTPGGLCLEQHTNFDGAFRGLVEGDEETPFNYFANSKVATELMLVNDSTTAKEAAREKKVASGLKKLGFEVTFVG